MAQNQEINLTGLRDLARLGVIKEFAFEQIKIEQKNKLNKGEIYQSWLYGQALAIKILQNKEDIIQSLEGLKNHAILNHDNILSLYGFSFHQNKLYLVSPFQNKGSLENFKQKINQIQDAQEKEKLILNILIDIAKGIQHLHQKQIIHRDLKPGNILLDDNFNSKICDFDYSVKQGQNIPFIVISEGYYAPELKQNPPLNSEKNDIYSFGKIAYFLFDNIISQDYIILVDCIKENPEERPSEDQILDKLNNIKQKKFKQDYIIPQKENKKKQDTSNKLHNFIYDFI